LLFVAIVECVPERIRELAEFAAKRGLIKRIKLIGNYGTPVGKGGYNTGSRERRICFCLFLANASFL